MQKNNAFITENAQYNKVRKLCLLKIYELQINIFILLKGRSKQKKIVQPNPIPSFTPTPSLTALSVSTPHNNAETLV